MFPMPPVLVFLLLFLLQSCVAHFPPQCRCVCHAGVLGLSRARGDCFAPGSADCRVRLCRRQNSAGFSCCMPDYSPYPVPEIPMDTAPTGEPASNPEPSEEPYLVAPIPPVTSKTAVISFAANDEVELVINGVSVAVIRDWTMVGTVRRELKDGDVVGIRAKNRGGFYGVIAAIEMAEKNYVTGDGSWKATTSFKIPGKYLQWAETVWSSCKWDVASVLPDSDKWVEGKSRSFPYATGAKYVWAANGGEFNGIYIRFVVGGEKC